MDPETLGILCSLAANPLWAGGSFVARGVLTALRARKHPFDQVWLRAVDAAVDEHDPARAWLRRPSIVTEVRRAFAEGRCLTDADLARALSGGPCTQERVGSLAGDLATALDEQCRQLPAKLGHEVTCPHVEYHSEC